MPKLNLFTATSIGSKSSGLVETSYGIGGRQPIPMFRGAGDAGDLWDGSAAPPYGLLMGTLERAWVYDNKLYCWINCAYGGSYYNGILRRSLVGDPPTHTIHDGYQTLATLFDFVANRHGGATIYDPTEQAFFGTRWYTSAQTNIVKRWEMSAWPFTSANATWTAIDTSYGSYQAGKITYYVWDAMICGDYLLLSSYFSGSVLVIDKATGAVVGEWAYDVNYTNANHFHFCGLSSTGKPIGGSAHVNGGNGAICVWDMSNPSAWTIDSVVVPAGDANRLSMHGYTYNNLSGATYYDNLILHLTPQEISLLGLGNTKILYAQDGSQYAPGGCIVEVDEDGSGYHRYLSTSGSLLIGKTGRKYSRTLAGGVANVVSLGGITYLVNPVAGTPEVVAQSGAIKALNIALIPISTQSCIYSFTATTPGTPLSLGLSKDDNGRDVAMSLDPLKHRFAIRINAGAWDDARSGYELADLGASVNGKAAWSGWSTGDLVEIRHELGTGAFRHLGPVSHSNPDGEADEEIVSLANAGMPVEVQAILTYDSSLPDSAKTQGRKPIARYAKILQPLGLYAEVTS